VSILAIDHGEKRIGLALSDPTRTIARPLGVVKHVSRAADAARVLALASAHGASAIVVGDSTDEDGNPNAAGRRARSFAETLGQLTKLKIILWDESMSTQDARAWRIASGASRKRRAERIDAVAAAVILQSYLDAQRAVGNGGER
jgi:putative Holliday junction resolvase